MHALEKQFPPSTNLITKYDTHACAHMPPPREWYLHTNILPYPENGILGAPFRDYFRHLNESYLMNEVVNIIQGSTAMDQAQLPLQDKIGSSTYNFINDKIASINISFPLFKYDYHFGISGTG